VAARWPVYVAVALLLVMTLICAVVFAAATLNSDSPEVTPEHYAERVGALLANADPVRGEQLIQEVQCAACHVSGAEIGIAPPFEGIGTRAETRRPPLGAAEYLYESIIHPQFFVVEDYTGSMPQNFAERLTDEQLGDLIAYLLTLR
jgi:mono/diheme cytochrome c family protein